jgi:hypothetical protein
VIEDELELSSNPGDGARVDAEAVRRLWRSWGFVEDVYCPGRSRTVTAPGADNVVPTVCRVKYTLYGVAKAELTGCVGEPLKALTCNADYC